MTKRNIEGSGESADAFEPTSESPDRGDLIGGPLPDELFDPPHRPTRGREVRVPRGPDPRRFATGGTRRFRDVGSPTERGPSAGEGAAPRPGCGRGQVVRVRRLLQRDLVGETSGDDRRKEDVPRLELQQSRRNRDGDEQGGPGGRDARPHLLLHRVDPVPPQFHASDREVLPNRHVAGQDEPRLHPVRGPRGRPRPDDDEPLAVPRGRRRRDALHGGHGPRGPRPPHARVPGRRVVASVRAPSGGGGRAMMQSPPKAIAPRAKTGIPVLDERLQGGFPRPSTLLLFSEKPTEKRLFGENFAIQGAKAGETCLYVDFFRAPQLARGELKRFGSVDPAKLVLVDATSSQLLLPSHEKYHIDNIESLATIREAIVAAMEAEQPGRLIVYFPRILVTGPFNAGKSTVVKAVSEKSISIDRMGTTVAFDYGNVNITGIDAEIFGTPGQERFEFIFKIFAREVSGVLLVVDASHPDELSRARQMLDLVGPRIPYVVLANKSDLPGAIPPEEITHRMKLADDVPVVPTVATENKGVRDALLMLAEMIIGVR